MNIPIFPGALTPSEIYKASTLGAAVVKVYPAGNLGASYIKDVKAPLDKVRMMPTGGITLDNMQNFLNVGVDGFGIGSPLFDKKLVDQKDWKGLEIHFCNFINLIQKHKNTKN